MDRLSFCFALQAIALRGFRNIETNVSHRIHTHTHTDTHLSALDTVKNAYTK